MIVTPPMMMDTTSTAFDFGSTWLATDAIILSIGSCFFAEVGDAVAEIGDAVVEIGDDVVFS